jgi:hypothetical protein
MKKSKIAERIDESTFIAAESDGDDLERPQLLIDTCQPAKWSNVPEE